LRTRLVNYTMGASLICTWLLPGRRESLIFKMFKQTVISEWQKRTKILYQIFRAW